MATVSKNDSHYPNDHVSNEQDPLPQHHRLALGRDVTGQDSRLNEILPSPNKNTVAGQRKNW